MEHAMTNYFYVLFLCIMTVECAPTINKYRQVKCKEIPELDLEDILGSAFNARYMSIDPPTIELSDNRKRSVLNLDFYVDSNYQEDLDEQPAWSFTNHAEAAMRHFGRDKRNAKFAQEWHCESRIKWTDLGPDYFPRYLRSVECLQQNCWYNMYKCKPKSFTVKVLKRKRGRCVVVDIETIEGETGVNRDLQELWVWEERAVSFCCDCSL